MYGALVRRARERRGLSQDQLAVVSGVAQPNISAIEHGRRIPTVDTLHRLLASCGFTVIAHDGRDALVFPADEDDDAPRSDEQPAITPQSPMADRVRALTAVLDASEAIVRARR